MVTVIIIVFSIQKKLPDVQQWGCKVYLDTFDVWFYDWSSKCLRHLTSWRVPIHTRFL